MMADILGGVLEVAAKGAITAVAVAVAVAVAATRIAVAIGGIGGCMPGAVDGANTASGGWSKNAAPGTVPNGLPTTPTAA